MSAPSTDKAAIEKIIDTLTGAGYTLDQVNDGEDEVKVTTKAEAVTAITAVDEAHLVVRSDAGKRSWVFFVLGNDPEEVAADHTVDLSDALDPLFETWWN